MYLCCIENYLKLKDMNNETPTQAFSRLIKEQMDLQNKNWFSVAHVENESKFFFYTNNTPTGKSSGILISLIKGEKGTRIYSKRRCLDLVKLISIDEFILQNSGLIKADEVYDYLNDVLQICKKNGQK
jgi:hypothetical protein